MPKLARQTRKSLVERGQLGSRCSRLACVLAVCLGLMLPAQKACGGFFSELLTFVGIQVVEYWTAQGLNAISDPSKNDLTATLLSIIGFEPPSNELNNQIAATQTMIANLQANLDNFEGNVNRDFAAVMQGQDQAAYNTAMTPVVNSLTAISTLIQGYTNVIHHCCTNVGTNWVLKSELSASERLVLTNFADGDELRTYPDQVLQWLQSASTAVSGSQCVYDTDLKLLKDQVPFEHQTYAGMYDLLNYMASLRVMALYFKKEYQAYQFQQRTDTNITYAEWMDDKLTPAVNSAAGWINSDVTNNVILCKMATLLTNTVATNAVQRLGYLEGLINVTQTFYAPPVYTICQGIATNEAYQVIANTDGRTYVIVKKAAILDYYWGAATPSYYTSTEDGRYELAYDVGDIEGLLQADQDSNPLAYLRATGALTDITQADGILLGRTGTNAGIDLYLLDAQAYSATGDPNQYLRIGGTPTGPLVTCLDVREQVTFPFSDGTQELDEAKFLSIFCDTHITGVKTNGAGYYTPADARELPNLFSLMDGDVLDLSGFSGTLAKTVHICGNATIIGGGRGKTISGFTIQTFGGNLTVSNLFLTSTAEVVDNIIGSLTLVAEGSSCFQSSVVGTEDTYGGTLRAVVLSSSGEYLTVTGPGSLEITNTSVGHAIGTEGPLIVRGATNLVVGSKGTNSIYAGGIYIVDSKLTSRVKLESDDEFVGNAVTLKDCSLDMSYGALNPQIIGNAMFLGKVRGQSWVTVTTSSDYGSGTEANIYVRIVGSTGGTGFMNISDLAWNPDGSLPFQAGDQDQFWMSYSITNSGVNGFQGLGTIQSIQLWEDESGTMPHWTCESVDLSPNVTGDVPTSYHFAVNHEFDSSTDIHTTVGTENYTFGYTALPDNTAIITAYAGSGGAVTIPSSIHGFTVNRIAASAFASRPSLTSVMIPNTVTNIEDEAFFNCVNLAAVYFQGSAPTLGGSNVFVHGGPRIYYLPGPPSPVTGNWSATFGGCETAVWVPFTYTTNQDGTTLTITGYNGLGGAVTFPSAINGRPVTGIADWTFNTLANVYSATVPSSITSIGIQAFRNCYSLVDVYFQGNAPALNQSAHSNPTFSMATVYCLPGTTGWGQTFNGCPTALWVPFTHTVNPNDTVTITGYTGLAGPVTIPPTIDGLPVTSIATKAFYQRTGLSSVLVPASVTNIGDGAFEMCADLTGVFLQGNAPSLGGPNVFKDDTNATVYCLSGNTNGPTVPGTFGGRPTARWLAVNDGSDAGVYTNLQQVAINASFPVGAAAFHRWTGDTQYVASVTSSNTTVNLPLEPVTLTATFYLLPAITTQPASQAAVCGQHVTLSATAGGTAPLAYQWYFNHSPLAGATTTSCSLRDVTGTNAGDYTLVVTNLYGSVTSSVATLTVHLPPSVATQPASHVAAEGDAVELSASVTGTAPLSYQWFKNGGMVSGATHSALSLPKASLADSGVYYVVVTNAYGLSLSLPASVAVGTPQLLAWGANGYGQLGDGSTTGSSLPLSVATNVVSAAAGGDQSLFVKADGTLWTVGYNGDGELADGTRTQRSVPESVASNVVAVAAGAWHSLYVKRDGTLWVAGQNDYGQLGDGTTNSRSLATSVASNVVAAAAGYGHSLYLKCDGTLWAMGNNAGGQLGDGTTTSRSLAEPVASNVVAVAAGADHSLYVKRDGTLWAMGLNLEGQLGDGTTVTRSRAVAVANGSEVMAVAAGDNHSLFAKADGTLWTVGRNDYGQLGDGTTFNRSNAVSVASNVVAVAAGGCHSLYLKSDGTLWGAGRDDCGQLGNGNATQWSPPLEVTGMSLASAFSGRSSAHTLAVGIPLPPRIATEPADQAVVLGSNVTFTVSATGVMPLVYQWYFQGNPRGGGTRLSLIGVRPTDAGDYTVVVSNASGSVTSRAATLTILVPPSITVQPACQRVLQGSNTTFNVTAEGTAPLTYQWYFNGTKLDGAVGTTYTLTAATSNDAGDYTVVVTNLCGGVTSSVASLAVFTLPSNYNQLSGQLWNAGDVRLSFAGIPGEKYALDRSFSLSPAKWVPQETNLADSAGALVFTNMPNPATNNFWRVRSVP